MTDRIGEVLLDKYTIERELGRGGMGYVVAARHRELDELVAIKLILKEHAQREDVVRRFMREARAATRIANEHVVRVMDVGRLPSGEPYMVMELLRGQDMEEMLRTRGPLPVAEAIDLVAQVLEAVAEAHAAGIVHRDLKPANVFLSARRSGPPCVKVLDFGISKLTGDAGETQGTLGSPLYMSPEQLRSSADVDHLTDIWALGVILFELLTGALPFVADTLAQLVVQVLHADPPRLRGPCPDLPPALEAAVLRCLDKDRTRRFASVAELARALAPFGTEAARRSLQTIESALPGPASVRPALASVPDADVAVVDPPSSSPVIQRTAVMSSVASTMDPVAAPSPTPSRVGWRLPLSLLAALVAVGLGAAAAVGSRRAAPESSTPRAEVASAPLPSSADVRAKEPAPVQAPDDPHVSSPASASVDVRAKEPAQVQAPGDPRASSPGSTSAPTSLAPPTGAPAAPARLPRTGPAKSSAPPPSAAPPAAVCNPPYTIGPGGKHVPKPECI